MPSTQFRQSGFQLLLVTKPAGWYRDPDGALRYWNGDAGADHSAPEAVEAPAAKKSRADWMVLIGLGAAVVVIIGVVVAAVILAMRMDLGEPTVAAQTTSASASAPSAAPEVVGTTVIGDEGPTETQAGWPGLEVRDGNFAFVVGDVERVDAVAAPENPEVQKQAQGEFVIVHITVTNVSAEPQPFYVSFSTLSDGATVYKSDDEAWLYLGNTVTDVVPGESLETAVVFDVPAGTDVESIQLHDSPSSPGVTVGL